MCCLLKKILTSVEGRNIIPRDVSLFNKCISTVTCSPPPPPPPPHTHTPRTSLSYMITGGNSGIGIKSTAMALARKGATVHIVCRNTTRGEEAKQEIISETGNDVRVT